MAIIGIDLGTTNSLGCVFRDGKLVLIPNDEGKFLTPSAVTMMEDGSIVVGQKAKDRKISHPNETVLSFKKLMGTQERVSLGKKSFLPEELSSFVIRSIIDDAERFLGETIEEAVISVPAYFHDKQRAATKRAGALAGVQVERIINEPSAAALASYWEKPGEANFLVIDFGGGTLDISMVECIDKIVEITTVSGDNQLGGDDFDKLIAEQFLKEHALKRGDLTDREYATLIKKASVCKESLSNNLVEEPTGQIQMVINDKVYESTYNMKRLIAESTEILNRIRNVIGKALKDAKMPASQVQEIIMVGGSSKMPLVQSYIRHLFHRNPTIRTDCDEAIALGLGVFCGVKERDSKVDQYILTDVCPFSLGTQVLNKADSSRPYMSTIIPRNSVLPCSRTESYTNATPFVKQMSFRILQGESVYADENIKLGDLTVDVTPMPVNQEIAEVTYTYDINGILIVDVNVPSTGAHMTKVISENLSTKELQRRTKELMEMKLNYAQLEENKQLVETLEQLHEEASPTQKEMIARMLSIFTEALKRNSPSAIAKARKIIEENLDSVKQWDPFATFTFSSEEEEFWDDPWADEDTFGDDPFEEDEENDPFGFLKKKFTS